MDHGFRHVFSGLPKFGGDHSYHNDKTQKGIHLTHEKGEPRWSEHHKPQNSGSTADSLKNHLKSQHEAENPKLDKAEDVGVPNLETLETEIVPKIGLDDRLFTEARKWRQLR